MQIVLTEEQRLLAEKGQAVEVVDSTTNQKYVITVQQKTKACQPDSAMAPDTEIPEGIRLSQEAFRRDLPALLVQKRLAGQFAAYHREHRLGISRNAETLFDQCIQGGLGETDFYVGWIHPSELIVVEEIEPRHHDED